LTMSDKKKPGKRVFNHMVRVQCPKSGALQWANVGSRGPVCCGCGAAGHEKVYRE